MNEQGTGRHAVLCSFMSGSQLGHWIAPLTPYVEATLG